MNTTRVRFRWILQYTSWVVPYAILLTLYTINTHYKNMDLDTPTRLDPQYSNILDGCYHVYLDVGSNLGVQVRKLFEPYKYPDAKVHRVFDLLFGERALRNYTMKGNDKHVCAVGFEPNSKLSKYLEEVESSYKKCGWRVTFLTATAVSDHYGTTQFYSDGQPEKYEWGGGILPHSIIKDAHDNSTKDNYAKVNLVRLSDFLKVVVGKRRIPQPIDTYKHKPPRVVMKVDIEGSEIEVIPDLLFSGGLEFVTVLMMEWHAFLQQKQQRIETTSLLSTIIESMSNYSRIMEDELGRKRAFRHLDVDDETYGMTKYDLPVC